MEYIGIVLCAFGGVGAVASFVVGKLSDRLGKMIFVIVGSLAHGTFFAFFLFLQLFSSIEWLHHHSYVLFIMSGTLLDCGPFPFGMATTLVMMNCATQAFWAWGTPAGTPLCRS